MNDRIRVPEVRLVGPNGEQVGVVRIEDALRLAAEADLDLVEVAPQAKPPVCKLMDYGKFKYEAAVKARESRKNQTNTVLKEVRFRLKIDSHDYETKTGHAKRFLAAGDKVKAMIQFRGREQQRPELGIRLLEKFASDVAELGSIESAPRIDGRNMVMVIGPLKNKAEAKAAARKSQSDAPEQAPTRRQQRAARMERIDTQKAAQSGHSVGDSMPEGLKKMAQASSEQPQQEAPAAKETSAKADAPAKQEPSAKKESTGSEAPKKPAAPKAPASKTPASKAPASKTPAPKAPASKTSAAKPSSSDSPAPKPASAPKPSAAPKPKAPAKPSAAPKPQGRPKPSAGRPSSS
nr:translation initiation factor IF-3 [Arthrobacter sp. UM1]